VSQKIVDRENSAYVVLDGDLDLFRKAEVAAALPDPEKIESAIINCTKAAYIDSMILGMLVHFRRQFVAAGGDPQQLMLMLPKTGPIRRTFELTGLTRLFAIAYSDPTDD
jgi:anti-anti-sigma factor